jgi:ORF6N domain
MFAMKSKKLQTMFPVTTVEGRIHIVRGRKVILDRDLAELYGASTKALNQAVKRNVQRFPDEFVFRLTKEEADALRSQFVTLNEADPDSRRGRHLKYLPFAFTEHGALMAANVLRSPRAVQMSVVVVQTFVRLSRLAVSMDTLARRVDELGHTTSKNSEQIEEIIAAIRELMTPPELPRREIGFHTRQQDKNPTAKRRN